MRLAARALRYVGIIAAYPYGSSQFIARANAAEGAARLRGVRQERTEVDAYLRERYANGRPSDETGTRPGWGDVEPAP